MSKKTLLLLRHAKSSWQTGAEDLLRPLSGRGLRNAQEVGTVLAEYPIDLVWCSPAIRTQQTWAHAQLGGATATKIENNSTIYYGTAKDLIIQITELDEDIDSLLVIGHQPTLSNIVATLTEPSGLADQASVHFPTAALAVLGYPGPWLTLDTGQAVLERFEIPQK